MSAIGMILGSQCGLVTLMNPIAVIPYGRNRLCDPRRDLACDGGDSTWHCPTLIIMAHTIINHPLLLENSRRGSHSLLRASLHIGWYPLKKGQHRVSFRIGQIKLICSWYRCKISDNIYTIPCMRHWFHHYQLCFQEASYCHQPVKSSNICMDV